MRKELDELLCSVAPNLYTGRTKGPHESCMAFGFECDDGWFGLLLEASEALEEIARDGIPESLQALQVKEKFGGLRIYLNYYTPEIDAIVQRAEERAVSECEICGAEGRIRSVSRHWLRCVCDEHDQSQEGG